MADLTLTAADVTVRGTHPPLAQFELGEAAAAGDAVALNSSGKLVKADAATSGDNLLIGIIIGSQYLGDTSFASGTMVDVALDGAQVTGFTGLTPGAKVYLSNTNGKLADATGTVTVTAGVAVDANTVLLNIQW